MTGKRPRRPERGRTREATGPGSDRTPGGPDDGQAAGHGKRPDTGSGPIPAKRPDTGQRAGHRQAAPTPGKRPDTGSAPTPAAGRTPAAAPTPGKGPPTPAGGRTPVGAPTPAGGRTPAAAPTPGRGPPTPGGGQTPATAGHRQRPRHRARGRTPGKAPTPAKDRTPHGRDQRPVRPAGARGLAGPGGRGGPDAGGCTVPSRGARALGRAGGRGDRRRGHRRRFPGSVSARPTRHNRSRRGGAGRRRVRGGADRAWRASRLKRSRVARKSRAAQCREAHGRQAPCRQAPSRQTQSRRASRNLVPGRPGRRGWTQRRTRGRRHPPSGRLPAGRGAPCCAPPGLRGPGRGSRTWPRRRSRRTTPWCWARRPRRRAARPAKRP